MPRIPALLLAALVAAAHAVYADPLPARAARVVDYTIDVRLDAVQKTLAGTERVTWTNPSGDQVADLWFHLYLNAFRNNRSTFFRESGGRLRGDEMPEDGWGWTDVTSMRLADGSDLLARATFERPDDGNADDFTVLRVPLPSPVAPGASVTLDVAWTARLPKVFARTGYSRDYYLVGQWYPKIAVYEPAGVRGRATGGWNCHQFHAHSEFYADFGRLHGQLQRALLVRGRRDRTARRRDPGPRRDDALHLRAGRRPRLRVDGRPALRGVQRPVLGQPRCRRGRVPQGRRELGRTLDEVRLTDVDIHLLLQPGHEPQAARYIAAAKAGIKYFGLWYGRYPYKTLTVVDPAIDAGGSGGMEYPTFITGGTSALFNWWPFDEVRAVEQVTIHEFGHQFWYGLVASNEFEEAWLDEGFNTYSTGRVVDTLYGPDVSVARLPGLHVGEQDVLRLQNTPLRIFDRVRQSAWTYSPDWYGFYSYTKPALLLRTLEGHLGTSDHGARDAHVPRAVALPPSVERRLLRGRQRGRRPRSLVVLQAGRRGHRRHRLRDRERHERTRAAAAGSPARQGRDVGDGGPGAEGRGALAPLAHAGARAPAGRRRVSDRRPAHLGGRIDRARAVGGDGHVDPGRARRLEAPPEGGARPREPHHARDQPHQQRPAPRRGSAPRGVVDDALDLLGAEHPGGSRPVTTPRARALPAFASGLHAAASRPWVVAAVWAWHLVIATAVAVPLFRVLVAATGLAPATDALLERFSFSLVGELQQYNNLPVGSTLMMGAVSALIVALASAPALLALVITSLDRSPRPAAGELAAMAGRYYVPFLRLFVAGRAVGLLAAALAGGLMAAALRPVRLSQWELGRLASGPVTIAFALVALALFWAATDYAMIHAIRTDSRRMFAAWRIGLRAAFTRPLATLGLWLLWAFLLALLAVLLFAVLGTLDARTPAAIVLAVVVQQLFVLARIGLRVSLLAAEGAVGRIGPEAVPVAVPVEQTRVETALVDDPEADVTPLPAPVPGRA